MEIHFADSFFKSLKTLQRHNRWYMKLFFLFRYNIPYFFRNLWWFKKELWKFRGWDSSFNMRLLKRSLEKTVYVIEKHGNEEEKSRNKKVAAIKRTIELLNNFITDNFIEQAEAELQTEVKFSSWAFDDESDDENDREHNKPIFDLAHKKENEQWKELWEIIKGNQDYKIVPYEELNGSDMRGWWD